MQTLVSQYIYIYIYTYNGFELQPFPLRNFFCWILSGNIYRRGLTRSMYGILFCCFCTGGFFGITALGFDQLNFSYIFLMQWRGGREILGQKKMLMGILEAFIMFLIPKTRRFGKYESIVFPHFSSGYFYFRTFT